MAGCQAETFQCAPSVQISKLVGRWLVAKKTATTFFLISCIKCLWDLVGHFLGLPFKTRKPLPAARYSHVCSLLKQDCYDQFK